MVELINTNREVMVLANAEENFQDKCTDIFMAVIGCVMEAKAEFCHCVRPECFLLDSTDEPDCLNADNRQGIRNCNIFSRGSYECDRE